MRTLCTVAEISLSLAVECYDPICFVAFHLTAPIFFYIILVDCSIFICHITLAEWSDFVFIIFLEICCCETEHGWNIITFVFCFCFLFFDVLYSVFFCYCKLNVYIIILLCLSCYVDFLGKLYDAVAFRFLRNGEGRLWEEAEPSVGGRKLETEHNNERLDQCWWWIWWRTWFRLEIG